MRHINLDKDNFPDNYSSFIQLAKYLEKEGLLAKPNFTKISICNRNTNYCVLENDSQNTVIYECTILDIKLGVFNELFNTIPDIGELINAKGELDYLLYNSTNSSHSLKKNVVLNFIDDIISLKTKN